MNFGKRSVSLHKRFRGKLALASKVPLQNNYDLAVAYTPGVAEPCRHIARNPEAAYDLTIKQSSVAVVSDGSRVLGLGNIGGLASIPVMEGKCLLFKRFADIDAFPICLSTQNEQEIIETVERIAPVFGGINLEDIETPKCYAIEKALQKRLDIPVFHDDQHGTATVIAAGMINALKLTGRTFQKSVFVISGAGAAGSACAKMLLRFGAKNITLCDRHGALYAGRGHLNWAKREIAKITNPEKKKGTLAQIICEADVFIGLSGGGLLKPAMVKSMTKNPIVFALANPVPEILPPQALGAGAALCATGRSDFPNQINNILVFPGLFRGMLDARVKHFHPDMCVAAAKAIAALVKKPSARCIIPSAFDKRVVPAVARVVRKVRTISNTG